MCAYSCTIKNDYWKHMRIHIPINKQFSCTYCEYVAKTKTLLLNHNLNHFNLKLFKCEQCNYKAINKKLLTAHLKTHKNDKFKCFNCKYTTKHNEYL